MAGSLASASLAPRANRSRISLPHRPVRRVIGSHVLNGTVVAVSAVAPDAPSDFVSPAPLTSRRSRSASTRASHSKRTDATVVFSQQQRRRRQQPQQPQRAAAAAAEPTTARAATAAATNTAGSANHRICNSYCSGDGTTASTADSGSIEKIGARATSDATTRPRQPIHSQVTQKPTGNANASSTPKVRAKEYATMYHYGLKLHMSISKVTKSLSSLSTHECSLYLHPWLYFVSSEELIASESMAAVIAMDGSGPSDVHETAEERRRHSRRRPLSRPSGTCRGMKFHEPTLYFTAQSSNEHRTTDS